MHVSNPEYNTNTVHVNEISPGDNLAANLESLISVSRTPASTEKSTAKSAHIVTEFFSKLCKAVDISECFQAGKMTVFISLLLSLTQPAVASDSSIEKGRKCSFYCKLCAYLDVGVQDYELNYTSNDETLSSSASLIPSRLPVIYCSDLQQIITLGLYLPRPICSFREDRFSQLASIRARVYTSAAFTTRQSIISEVKIAKGRKTSNLVIPIERADPEDFYRSEETFPKFEEFFYRVVCRITGQVDISLLSLLPEVGGDYYYKALVQWVLVALIHSQLQGLDEICAFTIFKLFFNEDGKAYIESFASIDTHTQKNISELWVDVEVSIQCTLLVIASVTMEIISVIDQECSEYLKMVDMVKSFAELVTPEISLFKFDNFFRIYLHLKANSAESGDDSFFDADHHALFKNIYQATLISGASGLFTNTAL